MSDLVEFLRARITEDEVYASRASAGPWRYDPGKEWRDPEGRMPSQEGVFAGPDGAEAVTVAITGLSDDPQSMRDGWHIARHDPARVLADVKAKRAIIDLYEQAASALDDAHARMSTKEGWPDWGDAVEREEEALEMALESLAAVYADHPDYRQEWAL